MPKAITQLVSNTQEIDKNLNIDKEKLEKKIGEAIGLELAAQKAVMELSSKGLLPGQSTTKNKLEGMRKQANNHQTKM